MSKTPPPSLRILGSTPPEDDSRQPESALSKLGQSIKNRLGEIQTKPEIIEKMKNFRLGEVQTKPDWMKRSPKQTHEEGPIRWVRIIPFAGEKYVADKLPSKLGGIGGVIHLRFLKDAQGKISLFAGHAKTSKLKNALRQRVPNTDLQDIDAPAQFEERFVNRVGELGGVFNEKGKLEAILDALEGETYLDIAFEERPEHEFKQVLRNHAYGGTEKNGSLSTLSALNEVFNPFSGASPSNNKSKSSKREMSVEERDQAKRIEALLSEHTNYFRVVIKIGAKHQNHIQTIFNELNTQMKKQHRFSLANEGKKKLWKNSMGADALWREEELAVLVALPDMTNAQMMRSVTHMKPGEHSLDDDILTAGVAIGRLIHPVKSARLIKIPLEQFLKHGFLTGKTGAGKTSAAIQAIQALLDDWGTNPNASPGFTYIDPNRSALITIINRLLHMEKHLGIHIPWEKVHYLDMRPESKYPVGLNLLHSSEDADITEVSQNIVDMIMSTYGSSGTLGKTEKLMDNGLATLLSDRSRVHTIFGLNYVYMYPSFRESLIIRDPMLKLFWKTDGADISTSDLTAMNNRLRPLLNATAMRRIFGQTNWTLNIRKWMDEGHIVLIDALGLSEVGRSIAMGQLVTQYHVVANQRLADISKPHILMIDEAHLVQIPILETVIAVDRKFGLSLVLITQSPEQFNSALQTAITENMGTFMCCKVGPKSARSMTAMMNNAFDIDTLQGLPGNDVAILTEINKVPFSFKVRSDPPVMYLPDGRVAKYDKEVGGETWHAQQWALDKTMELSVRDGRSIEEVDREFNEYDEWWQQFAPEDDEDDPSLHRGKSDGKAKIYKPSEDEQPILDAIVALAMDQRDWRGRTSALLTQLEDYMSEEELGDWTPNLLGALLARATTWLQSKGIEAESNRIRIGTEWNISIE